MSGGWVVIVIFVVPNQELSLVSLSPDFFSVVLCRYGYVDYVYFAVVV
jgi:hypothetical protein